LSCATQDPFHQGQGDISEAEYGLIFSVTRMSPKVLKRFKYNYKDKEIKVKGIWRVFSFVININQIISLCCLFSVIKIHAQELCTGVIHVDETKLCYYI
jgi:hypothetical protein